MLISPPYQAQWNWRAFFLSIVVAPGQQWSELKQLMCEALCFRKQQLIPAPQPQHMALCFALHLREPPLCGTSYFILIMAGYPWQLGSQWEPGFLKGMVVRMWSPHLSHRVWDPWGVNYYLSAIIHRLVQALASRATGKKSHEHVAWSVPDGQVRNTCLLHHCPDWTRLFFLKYFSASLLWLEEMSLPVFVLVQCTECAWCTALRSFPHVQWYSAHCQYGYMCFLHPLTGNLFSNTSSHESLARL